MYTLKKIDIYASEIAEYLNLKLIGNDFIIHSPSSSDNIIDNSLVFFEDVQIYNTKNAKNYRNILVILPEPLEVYPEYQSFLITKNPKINFIRVINEYFTEPDSYQISSSSKVSEKAKLARNISIGENVVIGPEVSIGENTQIFNNVVIKGRVEIGKNCIIKDNSTIGSIGYNFVKDENGEPMNYPNIGKIIIGNDVWIGSNACIESASLENTIIEDFVKIDDLVQIGYSSVIKKRTMITAGVMVSRHVKIGEDCIISPNSSIGENIKISDKVIVGMGAVVVNELKANSVFVGNPAHFLKSNQ